MRYVRRPQIVEAVRFVEPRDVRSFLADYREIKDGNGKRVIAFTLPPAYTATVWRGDWVVRYENRLLSMTDDDFNELYQELPPEQA